MDPILRPREVARVTGLSRATIYRRVSDGTFPGQVVLSRDKHGLPRTVGWRASEVQRWIDSREQAA
jgi:prophage regulatory protein